MPDHSVTSSLQLVLASSSVYRKQLLEKLQVPFITDSPDIDETRQPGEEPISLVQRLTIEKAAAVAQRHSNALIIASDQVAVLGSEILGKPGTKEKAVQQLKSQSGKTVRFMTGLCVWNTATGNYKYVLDTSDTRFRELSLQQIEDYIQKDSPLYCAGSIKTEGLGISLLEYIHGSDPNSLVGLPLIQLVTILENEKFFLYQEKF
ncbi:Maf family protein [Endozoicomonadaceae bacterium StTr2]